MKTAAVVLAAGKSERMGNNKLTQIMNDRSLIDHVLDALEHTKINQIIVVLGNKPDEIRSILEHRSGRIEIVINEEFEQGMTSSFKAGLRRAKMADAVFLVLGDQLILHPTCIDQAIELMAEAKPLIVSPIYKGKKGHPLLFSRELFQEILDLKETEIIRDIVQKHRRNILTINADDWVVTDIDNPEDLEKAEQEIKNQNKKRRIHH